MSAVTNFFKPRSEYLLDISTGDAEKTLKKKKGNLLADKSLFRRVASGGLAAAFLGLSLSSGFLTTMSTAPKASADWIGGVVCGASGLNDNDTYAYLGGNTGAMRDLQAGVKFTPDNGGITPVDTKTVPEGGKKTAYEKYGAFSPSFTGWTGVYIDKKSTDVFKGTGGKAEGADTSKQGSQKTIENANTVPLFSHNAGDCFGGTQIMAGFANFVFLVPQTTSWISAELFGFAYSNTISNETSPINDIYDEIETIIVGDTNAPNGLKDTLYLPFLTPVVMIGAISLLYIGVIKRSSTTALQAGVWMVIAGIAGFMFVSKPLIIPNASDMVVNAVTNATTTAIISDQDANALCNVSNSADQAAIIREVRCGIWYNSVYVPWVSGQYGATASDTGNAVFNNDPRNVLADGQTWPRYQLDAQGDTAFNQSEIAYAQLSGDGMTANGTWSGSDAGKAIGAAFLAWIAAIGAGAMIISSSFALLGYQFVMLLLVLLSPFFFLIGAAPGFGRRIAMRWLELITGLVVKRLLVSLILAFFLRLYSVVMGIQGMNYLFQMVIILIISFVCLTQRKTITNLFVDAIDFGGDKRINVDGGQASQGAGRVFAGLAGAAVGAVSANVAAGKITSSMVGSAFNQGPGVTAGVTAPTRGNENINAPANAPANVAASDQKTTSPTKDLGNGVTEANGVTVGPRNYTPVGDDTTTRVLPTTSPTGSPEIVAPAPISNVPMSNGRPIPQQYQNEAELEKLNKDIKRRAMRKGAIQGAQQGFASGKVGVGTVFSASQLGASVGDGVYDNEEVKLQSAARSNREQATLDLFGRQVESLERGEGVNAELNAASRRIDSNADIIQKEQARIDQETKQSLRELEKKADAQVEANNKSAQRDDEVRRTVQRIDRKANTITKAVGGTPVAPTASQGVSRPSQATPNPIDRSTAPVQRTNNALPPAKPDSNGNKGSNFPSKPTK